MFYILHCEVSIKSNKLKLENNKVGRPITRPTPYQTVRALLTHTAYQRGFNENELALCV